MGHYLRTVSERASIVCADDTWIEGDSIQQLVTTSQLPGMRRAVGMPDLHPGRGYPVGAAFFSEGRFYPALVGNDIGCGMALWSTSLIAGKTSVDALEKRLGSIDGPLEEGCCDDVHFDGSHSGFERALGTIGGGNHFAEIQQIDAIYDAEAMTALGIERRHLVLLVHSGSRGLGEAILRDHVDQYGHAGLETGSEASCAYLARHDDAVRFAQRNRRLIAHRMLKRLKATGTSLLDATHNAVVHRSIDGVDGWLHRKGATPSDDGLVVIPGSRGDFSFLIRPLPSAVSLYSLAHGAGRKWKRTDCRARLSRRYSPDQLRRTAMKSRVICDDRALLYEEAPEAYKSIDSVVGVLVSAGLVECVARLRPILTYKTREDRGA